MKWCEMMSSERVEGMEKSSKILAERAKRLPALMWKRFWNVGWEDPRRVIHAIKVGLSLTLVSLLYLIEPLFKEVGEGAIWAVMTVVVVLEFTAGTLFTLLCIILYCKLTFWKNSEVRTQLYMMSADMNLDTHPCNLPARPVESLVKEGKTQNPNISMRKSVT